MTPAERVVVETAVRLVNSLPARESEFGQCNVEICELREAVWGLLAERETVPKDQRAELDLTWGQVVEGDEIYSAKTGRWYKVRETALLDSGRSKIVAEGLPRPLRPKAADPVKVRRGATGQAVDMFATVLWSMPTSPETGGPDEGEI